MKIALLHPEPVPHAYGGMDRLLDGLAEALRQHHPTDLVGLPVDERSKEGVLKGYYDWYHLDLSAYDLVISTKGPSYMVQHPAHIPYLCHRMRVFYDLYEPQGEAHARLRRLIHWLDGWGLAPERTPEIFTIGETVSRRLRRWGGRDSTALRTPTNFEPLAPAPGEYFFAAGRLHPLKRFDLIIRAMRASRADAELVIAGAGPQEDELRALAAGDPRIRFAGHVGEEELRRLYAHAIATIFPPVNEDLGLVTFESFLTAKPVLTTTDSGEPGLIVEDGQTGFVCEPAPAALAERLEWMATHRAETAVLGEAGREWVARSVSWDRVTSALLAAGRRRLDAGTGRMVQGFTAGGKENDRPRIRLLVTDNQVVDPPVGGGRIRIWELYRHLPADFVTTYLGAWDHPGPQFRDRWLAPNFREIVMPLTAVHFKAHEAWRRATGGDATVDVTIPLLLGRCSPRYRRLLAEHWPQADLIATAHPWMAPFLPHPPGKPVIYDSQNCEAAVKTPLLERTMAGRWLARKVEATERLAVERADLVLACSPVDVDQFRERYGLAPERTLLIANGVDCLRIRPAAPDVRQESRRRLKHQFELDDGIWALFVGSDYAPNIETVDFLVRELAPAVPDVTLVLGGGATQGWRRRNPQATLPANVRAPGLLDHDDLLAFYEGADIALNPMAQGSGTNIKMLDYMAAGLPIVTTAVGARGLAGRAGEHWIEVEREGAAEALRTLAADGASRATLAVAGRRLAESTYDWVKIAAVYAEALRRLARPAGPTP